MQDVFIFTRICAYVAKLASVLILSLYILGTWRYARHKFLGIPNPGNPVIYFDDKRLQAFDIIREYVADNNSDDRRFRSSDDIYLRNMLKENGLNYYSDTAPNGTDLLTLGRYEARQWDLYLYADSPDSIDRAGVRYKGIFPLRNNWFYLHR